MRSLSERGKKMILMKMIAGYLVYELVALMKRNHLSGGLVEWLTITVVILFILLA